MKKIITTIVLVVASILSNAQYQKGNVTVNAGFSIGLIGYSYGYYSGASGFVPIFANVEYSVNEIFAVGPYVGFYTRSYVNGDFKFTSISLGARGTAHLSGWLNEKLDMGINEETVDLYAALHLGFESVSWKYRDESIPGYYANSSRGIFGPVLGVRYMFAPNFGAFFETGRGAFGWASLGVSLRL